MSLRTRCLCLGFKSTRHFSTIRANTICSWLPSNRYLLSHPRIIISSLNMSLDKIDTGALSSGAANGGSETQIGGQLNDVVTPVKISVCQLTSTEDKDKNLSTVSGLIEAAARAGSKMVFLPEAPDFIALDMDSAAKLAEPLDGPFMTTLKRLARTFDIWLSIGGFHQKLEMNRREDLPWMANTHVIVDNQGEIVSEYHKTHLFEVSSEIVGPGRGVKESDAVQAGSEIVKPVASPIGNLGLGICYDLRFADFSGSLRGLGAEALIYPSAFTVPTGQAHWEPLLRTRAIENQCYVIAAAQSGQHNPKRSSYGHSMVIDPWGRVIAEATEGQNIMTVDLNPNLVKEVRKRMEVYNHRRDDIYVGTDMRVTIPDSSLDEEVVPFGPIPLKMKFVFMESTLSRAFVNKKCVLPGHVLVITKRVAERMQDLSPAEISDLFQLVQKVQKLIEEIFCAKSSTVTAQDGPDAGQSVKHFHIHVIPRSPGDFGDNDTVYDKLAKHDKGNVKGWRNDDEMHTEAKMLREAFRRSSTTHKA